MSMKRTFSTREANTLKLFLAWWMERQREKEEEWIQFQIEDIRAIAKHGESQILKALSDLIAEGLIREIRIEKWIYGETGDEPKMKHKYQIAQQKPKMLEDGHEYRREIGHLPYGESYRIFFDVHIPKGAVVRYIAEYLALWQDDDLYLDGRNILKCRNQIEEVVHSIFEIIQNHSYKNMLLGPNDVKEKWELDFLAVLLFLDGIDVLTISDYELDAFVDTMGNPLAGLSFRITLKERFFQNFVYTTKGVDFSFDRLISPKKVAKIIQFSPEFRLSCGKEEYRLNRGGVPHLLMNMALADRQIVAVKVEELRTRANVKQDALEKALENFRRALRQKFGFPEVEPFFEIREGEIRLDGTIFQKKLEKA